LKKLERLPRKCESKLKKLLLEQERSVQELKMPDEELMSKALLRKLFSNNKRSSRSRKLLTKFKKEKNKRGSKERMPSKLKEMLKIKPRKRKDLKLERTKPLPLNRPQMKLLNN